MIEVVGNLWDYYEAGYPICITTNGFVKSNGCAVMGRGVAKQAADMFTDLPYLVGRHIIAYGWRSVWEVMPGIIIFPVKPNIENGKPGWSLPAELPIIEASLAALNNLRLASNYKAVFLPRPGCGAGWLAWSDVKPLCEKYGNWLRVIDLN